MAKRKMKRSLRRKKHCRLCSQKQDNIDYKDVNLLQHYITDRGKIVPSRISGACAKHQRKLQEAIKRARYAALIPYVSR